MHASRGAGEPGEWLGWRPVRRAFSGSDCERGRNGEGRFGQPRWVHWRYGYSRSSVAVRAPLDVMGQKLSSGEHDS
ncbi:uncharacterized protein A4U43_C04F8160 [Asparagus officinalis]|uniref:Uncharacterized protein n=1 Tax=Asparagus officinalis TaxID=4686 RepID=A0A5P1F4K9_ASPOF|nr:uncharacterized protein A4U43_C04F8160 [Asparagus officinalis]